MAQSDINILQRYFDEVINQKRLDLIPRYFSESFVGHGTPYVGMGFVPDSTSGTMVVVRKINPNSPAAGKLMEGDVILRAREGEHSWETFEQLRYGGLWGQGVAGTSLTLWVRRGNEEKEINITRALIQGFQFPYNLHEPMMRDFFKEWPDVKVRLVNVIESGDMVAFHADYQGHNTVFDRSAMWSEFGFMRFKDGKITEWWGSDEAVSTLKQLGYSVRAPEMVKV